MYVHVYFHVVRVCCYSISCELVLARILDSPSWLVPFLINGVAIFAAGAQARLALRIEVNVGAYDHGLMDDVPNNGTLEAYNNVHVHTLIHYVEKALLLRV